MVIGIFLATPKLGAVVLAVAGLVKEEAAVLFGIVLELTEAPPELAALENNDKRTTCIAFVRCQVSIFSTRLGQLRRDPQLGYSLSFPPSDRDDCVPSSPHERWYSRFTWYRGSCVVS